MNTQRIEVCPLEFAMEGNKDFKHVEDIDDCDSLYKDFISCTTVCQQVSTGKYFALDWSKYVSHYGQGDHEFPSNEIYEVEEIEVVKVTKEWKAK